MMTRLMRAVALMGFVVWAWAGPGFAHAAVNCAAPSAIADADRDGLSDEQECRGLTSLAGGQTLKYSDRSTADGIQSCVGSNLIREKCLHPDTPDIFIMLKLLSPSDIPTDCLLFEPINRAPASKNGGIGTTTHNISPGSDAFERRVTIIHHAVQLTESSSETDGDWGQTEWGGPDNLFCDLGGCPGPPLITSYPKRVRKWLIGKGVTDTATQNNVICRSVAHEVAHSIGLHYDLNVQYDGPHTAPGAGYLVDQTITVSTKQGITTVKAPTASTSAMVTNKCPREIAPQLEGGACVSP